MITVAIILMRNGVSVKGLSQLRPVGHKPSQDEKNLIK